jgi:hypothetical protein
VRPINRPSSTRSTGLTGPSSTLQTLRTGFISSIPEICSAASLSGWPLVCFSHAGYRVQLENGFGVSQVGLAGKADEKDVQVVASICATRSLKTNFR